MATGGIQFLGGCFTLAGAVIALNAAKKEAASATVTPVGVVPTSPRDAVKSPRGDAEQGRGKKVEVQQKNATELPAQKKQAMEDKIQAVEDKLQGA